MSRYAWAPPSGDLLDGPLAVRVFGDGEPMLLLHGLGGSNRYWGGSYDALGAANFVVVPDLLGFGSSPKPTHGYGVSAHVDALLGTLDWLGVHEPVVIGAHSIGTLVALALADRHPSRVSRIVAVGPPLYPDSATARQRISELGWIERQLAEGRPAAKWFCSFVCEHRDLVAIAAPLVRRRLPKAIAADGVHHSWASYSETFGAFILDAPGDSWVASTHIPIRLLAGQRDPVLDLPHLRHLDRDLHHVSLLEVPGVDHDLPLALPAMVIDELRAQGPVDLRSASR